jgi:hypothetical protein
MFDGTIPVELERLKQIYRSVDHLSSSIAAFAADAHREGFSADVRERIDALERETDTIKELFAGILTDEEQDELMKPEPKPHEPKADPWEY